MNYFFSFCTKLKIIQIAIISVQVKFHLGETLSYTKQDFIWLTYLIFINFYLFNFITKNSILFGKTRFKSV